MKILIFIFVGWVLRMFYDTDKSQIDPILVKLKDFVLSLITKLKNKIKK